MRIFIKLVFFTMLVFAPISLHAQSLINCGNGGSASLGDIKHEVRLSCGEPEGIEIIGYIDQKIDKERIRVMKIEEWIYSAQHYGKQKHYSLIFEGNKLVEIKRIDSK